MNINLPAGIKLPDSVWIKALRWAFVQSFGSKAKVEFDQKIEPYIEKILATNDGNLNVSTITDILQQQGIISKLIAEVVKDLKIDPSYAPVIGFFVQSWLVDAINAKLGLKSKSKLAVSKSIK